MTQVSVIDLHQLNVKTTRQYKSSDTEYGATSVNEEANPQNNNRNIAFLTKRFEQINIALEQKESRRFPRNLGIEACRRELTSEKGKLIHQLKSDEE